MKKVLVALIIAIMPLPAMTAGAAGGGDRPLLMAGKHSLYQRVLSVPGARIADQPGAQAHTAVVPFTAFYVYARQQQGGTEWIEVGTDRHGNRVGWLAGTDSIAWNHGLTAAFRDPAGHDRVLLFRDSDSLRQLAGQSNLKTYQRLYGEAVQGQLSDGVFQRFPCQGLFQRLDGIVVGGRNGVIQPGIKGAAFAAGVEHLSFGDGKQPGAHLALAAKIDRAFPDGQHDILEHLFGQLTIVQLTDEVVQ